MTRSSGELSSKHVMPPSDQPSLPGSLPLDWKAIKRKELTCLFSFLVGVTDRGGCYLIEKEKERIAVTTESYEDWQTERIRKHIWGSWIWISFKAIISYCIVNAPEHKNSKSVKVFKIYCLLMQDNCLPMNQLDSVVGFIADFVSPCKEINLLVTNSVTIKQVITKLWLL